MTDHGGIVGVVVVAAGKGRRMGGNQSKQFMELEGKPLFIQTLERLQSSPLIDLIVLVVSRDAIDEVRLLTADARLTKIADVVQGGTERQDSVWRGLVSLKPHDPEYVLVHDGVRPFIDNDLIDRVVQAAVHSHAAVPAVRVKETVKVVDENYCIQETLSRDRLWLAQTPQAFEFNLLFRAYERAREEGFTGTDDASLVERLGETVAVIEGSYQNIKITTPQDLEVARIIALRQKDSHGWS